LRGLHLDQSLKLGEGGLLFTEALIIEPQQSLLIALNRLIANVLAQLVLKVKEVTGRTEKDRAN
jgi:hypothetical protein